MEMESNTTEIMEEEFNETAYYLVFDCTSDPTAAEMFESFDRNPGAFICLIIATVITAVQAVIMIDGVVWISRNIPHTERSTSMIWLYSIWPVYCIVSLCGLYIPKAALLSNAAANLFLFPILYNYLALLVDYFGGEDAMIGKMKDFPVKYNRPPCFCCCCCCPAGVCSHVLKRHHYNVLELLVMQISVVRPILLFLSQIFAIDGTFRMDNLFDVTSPGLYIQVATVASTLTAMQVLGTINHASRPRLSQYSIMPKYFIVQFALLMCNLQNAVVGFVLSGIGGCSNPYPYKSRAYIWNCFLIIIWSLIFQPICIKYLRTLKGNVLFIPEQLTKSRTYEGSSLKKAGEEDAEEADEAANLLRVTDRTPLVMRKSRSHSDIKQSYGSVITV